MMKRKNVILLVLSSTMVFGVTALSLNEKSNKILAAQVPTSRTFTFNKNYRASGYSATASGGTIGYTQTNVTASGGCINVSGSYGGTSSQTMDFAPSDAWLSCTAIDVGACYIDFCFAIKGITSIAYDITLGTPYEGAHDNYLQVYDSSTNILAKLTGDGTQSMDIASGTSATAHFYVFRYATFTINSITFTYNCQGVLS